MVIKLRTIVIALSVVIALCFASLLSSFVSSSAIVPKQNKLIVIDAGHGGIDGGVVGKKTGVKESDINLAISRALEKKLKASGFDVVLTRTTTDGLYGMSSKNKKKADMEVRKKIIIQSRPDLVVSVHQNSYPLPSVKGAQVFYAKQSKISCEYAITTQKLLNAALNGTKEAKIGDYFILQCSDSPSLLIECGFLTNAEEEKLLVSAAYQDKVAYSISSAIQFLFVNINKKG